MFVPPDQARIHPADELLKLTEEQETAVNETRACLDEVTRNLLQAALGDGLLAKKKVPSLKDLLRRAGSFEARSPSLVQYLKLIPGSPTTEADVCAALDSFPSPPPGRSVLVVGDQPV